MAMNASVLGPQLAIAAGSIDAPGQACWAALAAKIIEHIQTTATITVTGAAAGVTAGPATAVVTGTATIA